MSRKTTTRQAPETELARPPSAQFEQTVRRMLNTPPEPHKTLAKANQPKKKPA